MMKIELECQECNKVFKRSTKRMFPHKCPRCKSYDLYPTSVMLEFGATPLLIH